MTASQDNTGAADQKVNDATSRWKTMLYLAGECLVVGEVWAMLSPLEEVKEFRALEDQNSLKPLHSSSFFNEILMNVGLMPVIRSHASGGFIAESIPCVQASIALHF